MEANAKNLLERSSDGCDVEWPMMGAAVDSSVFRGKQLDRLTAVVSQQFNGETVCCDDDDENRLDEESLCASVLRSIWIEVAVAML
jgi:hypothetical protein